MRGEGCFGGDEGYVMGRWSTKCGASALVLQGKSHFLHGRDSFSSYVISQAVFFSLLPSLFILRSCCLGRSADTEAGLRLGSRLCWPCQPRGGWLSCHPGVKNTRARRGERVDGISLSITFCVGAAGTFLSLPRTATRVVFPSSSIERRWHNCAPHRFCISVFCK